MMKCDNCGERMFIPANTHKRLVEFKAKYPWVTNTDLAKLFCVTKARIGEILKKEMS